MGEIGYGGLEGFARRGNSILRYKQVNLQVRLVSLQE